jgi:DNA-directed RNA polymerase specialized sigma subunit
MQKSQKIYKAFKNKPDFDGVRLKDLDYLSEDSSLESYFKSNEDNPFIQKLEKIRGQILTERQDQIIQMVFKGNLSFSQIGVALKISRQSIAVQYHKAISKLSRYFKQSYC